MQRALALTSAVGSSFAKYTVADNITISISKSLPTSLSVGINLKICVTTESGLNNRLVLITIL